MSAERNLESLHSQWLDDLQEALQIGAYMVIDRQDGNPGAAAGTRLVGYKQGNFLIVEPVLQEVSELGLPAGTPVRVRFHNGDQSLSFQSLMLGEAMGPERLRLLDYPQELKVREQRLAPRTPVNIRAKVETPCESRPPQSVRVIDMSHEGCQLKLDSTEHSFQEGDSILVRIIQPKSKGHIYVDATIRHLQSFHPAGTKAFTLIGAEFQTQVIGEFKDTLTGLMRRYAA